MAKVRDSSKLVSENDPKYVEWMKFLSAIRGAGHSFNSEPRGTREAANYLLQQYDKPRA